MKYSIFVTMKDVLNYKGFIGSVHFSADDNIFYGKIEGITDLVTFESETVKELTEAFQSINILMRL
jgi:predicted HicB family RNase H-like nuclease